MTRFEAADRSVRAPQRRAETHTAAVSAVHSSFCAEFPSAPRRVAEFPLGGFDAVRSFEEGSVGAQAGLSGPSRCKGGRLPLVAAAAAKA